MNEGVHKIIKNLPQFWMQIVLSVSQVFAKHLSRQRILPLDSIMPDAFNKSCPQRLQLFFGLCNGLQPPTHSDENNIIILTSFALGREAAAFRFLFIRFLPFRDVCICIT